jgi:hypothetical protein
MDASGLGVDQRPKPGGCRVAEHRLGSRVEEGGPKSTPQRKGRVADRVDARVGSVETSRRDPPGDCAVADSGGLELGTADHAELPLRGGRKRICVEFPPLSGGDATQMGHGPIFIAGFRRSAWRM